jgi:hypothetical protein
LAVVSNLTNTPLSTSSSNNNTHPHQSIDSHTQLPRHHRYPSFTISSLPYQFSLLH